MNENENEDVEKEERKKMLIQSHGSRIREIRLRENLSQEKLAELLDVEDRTLRYIENGEAFLDGKAAIILYVEFGYSLNWIYGISEIDKDDDIKYYVDMRDMVKIKDGQVDISIKKCLYDMLANIEKSNSIKELELDENFIPLCREIGKQKRLFLYSHSKREYYCASISAEQFEVKTEQV